MPSHIDPKVTQHPETKKFHVAGQVESHAASELASAEARLSVEVVSLTRTIGGGFAYDFAVSVQEPPFPEPSLDEQLANTSPDAHDGD